MDWFLNNDLPTKCSFSSFKNTISIKHISVDRKVSQLKHKDFYLHGDPSTVRFCLASPFPRGAEMDRLVLLYSPGTMHFHRCWEGLYLLSAHWNSPGGSPRRRCLDKTREDHQWHSSKKNTKRAISGVSYMGHFILPPTFLSRVCF